MTSAYREKRRKWNQEPMRASEPPPHYDEPPADWCRSERASKTPYGGTWHLAVGYRRYGPHKGELALECSYIKDTRGNWTFTATPPQDHEPGQACHHCLARWTKEELQRMPARNHRTATAPSPALEDRDDKLLEILWREAGRRCGARATGTPIIPDPDAVWEEFKVVLKELEYNLWLTR